MRACVRARACLCVSNRQDVCRAECCGSTAKERNKFEPHNEVNSCNFSKNERSLLGNTVSLLYCVTFDV